MNTYERINRLLRHYGRRDFQIKPSEAWGGNHDLLDALDRRAGIDTRGGLSRSATLGVYCNAVGKRITLHEDRLDIPPYFWLGEQAIN